MHDSNEHKAQNLQNKLDIIEQLKEEREVSDKLYALKWVERIVVAIVILITTAFFTALARLVIKQ